MGDLIIQGGIWFPIPTHEDFKINCQAARKSICVEKLGALSLAHPGVRMGILAPVKSNTAVHTRASFIPSNRASAPSTQLTSVTAIIKGVGNRV